MEYKWVQKILGHTTIKQVPYPDLPDFIHDQLYRELHDEDETDEEYQTKISSISLFLIQYDPNNPEDKTILEEFLAGKIRNEGKPDPTEVNAIGMSGRIMDPILVLDGECREGRHRLAAALKYNLPIQAYVF